MDHVTNKWSNNVWNDRIINVQLNLNLRLLFPVKNKHESNEYKWCYLQWHCLFRKLESRLQMDYFTINCYTVNQQNQKNEFPNFIFFSFQSESTSQTTSLPEEKPTPSRACLTRWRPWERNKTPNFDLFLFEIQQQQTMIFLFEFIMFVLFQPTFPFYYSERGQFLLFKQFFETSFF